MRFKIGLCVVCKRLNDSIKIYAYPSVPDGRPTTNLEICLNLGKCS